MRSTEERINLMHRRTEELLNRREKRIMTGMGSVSAFLGLILVVFTVYSVGVPGAITDAAMAGTSMLADSVGGYVMVAVISFIVAVVITATCLKYRQGKPDELPKDTQANASGNTNLTGKEL